MSFIDVLFGKPLASDAEGDQRVGPAAGIPIFGLDALSSAAYGPEAALTLLIPLGLLGVHHILPISASIVALLIIVFFSYRQTIQAYPGGGGSYTVATENLGTFAGLLAAAALMVDYLLTVAVGISAGVGALISAVPSMQPYTLPICLAILAIITIVNLRGLREAGAIFMVPTYLFVGCIGIALVVGVVKTILSGGHPVPVVAPPAMPAATGAVGVWLILKAFASGCTAMTGVEAVSNGVRAFKEPAIPNAQRTLTVIIAILICLLAGIAFLCKVYGVGATDPSQPGYQSVLSQLLAATTGTGFFYYLSIGSILLVLSLSANTAFADFPRLCRAIAQNSYLPHSFAALGRRLVYSQGVYVLAFLCACLLVVFRGVTDRLIPLYAVGAFLAFTLSQAGMVFHWRRNPGPGATRSMLFNGLGAIVTGITLLVVLVAKFIEGAWIVILLIPAILLIMRGVRRHYNYVERETASPSPVEFDSLCEPIVVVPIERWSRISKRALRLAVTLSGEVKALHIQCGEEEAAFCRQWTEYVEGPARKAGRPVPELVLLQSPYRFVTMPILNYVLDLEQKNQDRQIAVMIPELVEKHWYNYLMHNKRAAILKGRLLIGGNQRIVVINVPWYLKA